jgi:hypothetical protein
MGSPHYSTDDDSCTYSPVPSRPRCSLRRSRGGDATPLSFNFGSSCRGAFPSSGVLWRAATKSRQKAARCVAGAARHRNTAEPAFQTVRGRVGYSGGRGCGCVQRATTGSGPLWSDDITAPTVRHVTQRATGYGLRVRSGCAWCACASGAWSCRTTAARRGRLTGSGN